MAGGEAGRPVLLHDLAHGAWMQEAWAQDAWRQETWVQEEKGREALMRSQR